jgi:predicted anti-sigma-YlaC factor YlaD
MHRLIQDHLEEVLSEPGGKGKASGSLTEHLASCQDCSDELSAMRHQAAMLRALRTNDDVSPRAGFYARVMERIEAQRPIDIWQLFFDSAFARRMAMASMVLVVFFGVYLISSEHYAPPVAVAVEEVQPGMTLSQAGLPDKDTVLVNLVTYREQ